MKSKWLCGNVENVNSWSRRLSPLNCLGGMGALSVRTFVQELHSYSTQSVWGVILREVQLLASEGFDFLSRSKIRVGDGVNTRFWLDTWILDVPLSIRCPRLYALESDKQIKVAAKFGDSSLADSFRRQVRDGVKASQWTELLSLTGSVSLSSSSDRWICDCKGLPIKLKTILEGVFILLGGISRSLPKPFIFDSSLSKAICDS
ncbi:hypothetical protein Tco_1524192 [Tanacetum coccineum]